MNTEQLTEKMKNDLDGTEHLKGIPIISVMHAIRKSADKHAEKFTRADMFEFVHYLRPDAEIWDNILVLRVCTLEDAIREAMVISACGSVLKYYRYVKCSATV